MGSKNPLSKLRHRPGTGVSLGPSFSFRFNPAGEDLLEELTPQDQPVKEAKGLPAPPSCIRHPLEEDQDLPYQTGFAEELSLTSSSHKSGSLSNSSSQSEIVSHKSTSEKSSRDASPLKETTTKSFSKASKRSSSLDNQEGDRWTLSMSNIKGIITKRYEEIIDPPALSSSSSSAGRGATDSSPQEGSHKCSPTNGEIPAGTKTLLSARSQSSLDVRSNLPFQEDKAVGTTRSISVEEGIDIASEEPRPPGPREATKAPFSQEMIDFSQTKASPKVQPSPPLPPPLPLPPGKKSAVSYVTSGAQAWLASKRQTPKLAATKNVHKSLDTGSITLSSLKATRSFESELMAADEIEDLSTWEILDTENALEEKPETPIVFEKKSSGCPSLADQQLGSHGFVLRAQEVWRSLPPMREELVIDPVFKRRLVSLLVLLGALLLAPISSFWPGLVSGCILSFIFGSLLWWLYQPSRVKDRLKIPDYKTLPPLTILKTKDLDSDPVIAKGWMNELTSPWDPETYNVSSTQSVFVRLQGSQLRFNYPKANISRRAMWNEPKINQVFVFQHFHNLRGASVTLPPEGLVRKRLWSKKYPICLVIHPEAKSQMEEEGNSSLLKKEGEKTFSVEAKSTCLYLFARTCREKEEWHRRFQAASMGKSWSSSSFQGNFGQDLETPVPSLPLKGPLLASSEDTPFEEPLSRPLINYSSYMAKFLVPVLEGARDRASRNQSDSNLEKASSFSQLEPPSCAWLNALVGRLFFDFFTHASWAQMMSERIQRKLSVIKVPYFMDELKLRDIDLGSNLPVFKRSSHPTLDERGLWIDFDVAYQGTFQMTLETKLNLMRLKKDQSFCSEKGFSPAPGEIPKGGEGEREGEGELSPHPKTLSKPYLYNSDEEDSAESSSDEDLDTIDYIQEEGSLTTTSLASSSSSPANRASTSKKLLHWVDILTQNRYFQQVSELGYIKKAMAEVSKTPILLTVEVHGLVGTLALNLPPPPSDRLWYGFRGNPQLSITARPKLGETVVTLKQITDWIEKKLSLEFQKLLVMPNMDDLVIPIMESGFSNLHKNC